MANILRLLLLAACCAAGGLLAFGAHTTVAPAAAGSIGGFVSEVAFDNLPSPIDFAFAPDGRIFVAIKSGQVRIIKNGTLLPTPFITLPVNTYFDHGLESIVLDPSFGANGYVYLYYVYENNPANFIGRKTSQLIRVTANGDVADLGSKVVLLGTVVGDPSHPSCEDFPAGTDCLPADGFSHIGGGLAFAQDGTLLLTTGDASLVPNYFPWAPIVLALMTRSQNLNSLAGKLLRIDPATGAGPPDNPFFTGYATANRSKVVAYGFRNPFRMAVDPATGVQLVGDVGSDYWEELNVAQPGANFGWPCYEGTETAEQPYQNTLSVCEALYASGTPNTHPLYSYSHEASATVIAGQFYHGSNYPPDFAGAFFFGDWERNTISFLPADPDTGQLLPDSAEQLLAGAGAPVAFHVGPGGDIYYSSWAGYGPYGQIRHIRFVEGDRQPVAKAAASPEGGLAPLSVQFSSNGSFDPDEGDTVSFAWNFGDGATSTNPNPVHAFAQNGTYHVQLTVTDGGGAMGNAALSVIVGNRPPVATITAPRINGVYQGGQSVAFSGTGQDGEDGSLSPSHLDWTVVLHHCFPAAHSCHAHPFLDKAGASGTLIAPGGGTDTELFYLELQLTVTDSAGLTDMASVPIGPAGDGDGDGVLDYQELAILHTDPVDPDSDHNSISDGAQDFDGDGCANARELAANPRLGGLRDPNNVWDYADMPPRDRKIRINDISYVISRYRHDPAGTVPPLYDPLADHSYVGPQPSNLGPPDGRIRIDDVSNVIGQYRHDCA